MTIEHPSEAPYRFILHRPPAGIMRHPLFREGAKAVASRRRLFDSSIFHHQLPELARLADDVPDLRIIVNNLGLAMMLETEHGRPL